MSFVSRCSEEEPTVEDIAPPNVSSTDFVSTSLNDAIEIIAAFFIAFTSLDLTKLPKLAPHETKTKEKIIKKKKIEDEEIIDEIVIVSCLFIYLLLFILFYF